jgi:hypothetical protein
MEYSQGERLVKHKVAGAMAPATFLGQKNLAETVWLQKVTGWGLMGWGMKTTQSSGPRLDHPEAV